MIRKRRAATRQRALDLINAAAWALRDDGHPDAEHVLRVVESMILGGDVETLVRLREAADNLVLSKLKKGRSSTKRTAVARIMRELITRFGAERGLAYALRVAADSFPSLDLGKPRRTAYDVVRSNCTTFKPAAMVKEIFRMCGDDPKKADNLFAGERVAKSRRRVPKS